MSHQLISRNPDLKRLRDEGYDLEIRSSFLLVKDIPYFNSGKEVKRGVLVSELNLAGDQTVPPSTHVAHFCGDHPCDVNGDHIEKIKNASQRTMVCEGLVIDHTFSAKPVPEGRYRDFHHKVETYVGLISGPAESVQPNISAKTFPIYVPAEEESVFNYLDTASSRAGIDALSSKLKIGKVAIIGLGGTGSYILDLIAKTPISEIHLFDGDVFLNHNAFRSPGASSIENLKKKQLKAAYFRDLYSKMHRHIFAHDFYVDSSNVGELKDMNFVFLSLDNGEAKKLIIQSLMEWNVPFIDVGMGVNQNEGSLFGQVRTTACVAGQQDAERIKQRIPLSQADENNEYSTNIQIADLNALNATLAVIKWKKICGFYKDLDREHYSAYMIDGNTLVNDDKI